MITRGVGVGKGKMSKGGLLYGVRWKLNFCFVCLLLLLMETVTDFIFLGSKITADVTAAMKLRHLLLGRKAMTNLDSILKSRDITLLTKVCLVKALIFPTVMYGCESWTIKKAECQRIDGFELWCWRRLLRAPRCKEVKLVNLEEINPGYSLEGPMLALWPPDAKS